MLVRATKADQDAPEAFGAAVRQVARLAPGGEWFRQLAASLAAIQDVANGEITAGRAREALEALLRPLPEPARAHACQLLISDLEAAYAMAGEPSPPWLCVLKSYFGGAAESVVPPGNYLGGNDG